MRIDRVVIGMDFSAPSLAAARWAATVLAPDAELVLTHVIEEPGWVGLPGRSTASEIAEPRTPDAAAERLAVASAEFEPRRCHREVRRGDPATVLAAMARERAADLIVVGAHRERHGLPGRIGRTAERLLGETSVPVLSVGGVGPTPHHVVAAVDGSPVSTDVSGWSAELAKRFGAKRTLLTVTPAPAFPPLVASVAELGGDGAAEGRDEWIARELGPLGAPDGDRQIRRGDAAEEILEAASNDDNGLIVVGRRGAGRTQRALFGSVTGALLRRANGPVLVVPEPALPKGAR